MTSKLLVLIHENIAKRPAIRALQVHISKNCPEVIPIVSSKILPCSILLERVPDEMTEETRAKYRRLAKD